MEGDAMKHLSIILMLCVVCFSADISLGATKNQPNTPDIKTKLNTIQVPFIQNQGQMHEDVAFSAQTFGGTLFVTTKGELVLSLPPQKGKEQRSTVIREVLRDARITQITGKERSQTNVSYFKGDDPKKWQRHIAAYESISLGEVYEGIELNLRAYANNVEKLFIIEPGADPASIRINVKGAKALQVNSNGELVVETGPGTVTFTQPVAYQRIDGETKYVKVAYHVADAGYSFKVGDYDKNKDLIIDPLLQSTYLGGSGDYDDAYGVAIHPIYEMVYVVGKTYSEDFPGTTGGAQETYGGATTGIYRGDVFVAILSSNLTTLTQATYFGGSLWDEPSFGGSPPIAFHPVTGDVYITGLTNSLDLPWKTGGAQSNRSGGTDAFVTRLTYDLTSLQQSTYLGGNQDDYAYAIAFNPALESGSYYLYITGTTQSTDLPGINVSSYQQAHGGGMRDAFVARLHENLQSFETTYLGGSGEDYGYGIAIRQEPLDLIYGIYVTGQTGSPNFPGTKGGAQSKIKGGDAFVSLFALGGVGNLKQSTYLGGGGTDSGQAIAIHPATGDVYVTGTTDSVNFPCTKLNPVGCLNGGQSVYGGGFGTDAFVARLNGYLTALWQATYLGGSDRDNGMDIEISPISGDIYVTGYTVSTNFPKRQNGIQKALSGYQDAFVSCLSRELTTIRQSTYLGGSSGEISTSIAIHPVSGDVYAAGLTYSTDFPGTAGGYQETKAGSPGMGKDTFITQMDATLKGLGLGFPNGGEVFHPTVEYPIVWVAPSGSAAAKFKLEYTVNNGQDWLPITTDFVPGPLYLWKVPKQTGNKTQCFVKVTGYKANGVKVGSDISDAPFAIEVLKLDSPDGGEILTSGNTHTVSWTTYATKKPVQKVELQYRLDTQGGWQTFKKFKKGDNPGLYDWVVPTVAQTVGTCQMRVLLTDALGMILVKDMCDGYFTIQPAP
jgi:hypothetical protein